VKITIAQGIYFIFNIGQINRMNSKSTLVVFLVLVLLVSPFLAINPPKAQAQPNGNDTGLSPNSDSATMNGGGNLSTNTIQDPNATKTYETRIGNLSTQYGWVTNETAKKMSDEFLFHTALQVYLLALPAVSGAGIFNGVDKLGFNNTDILYFSEPITSGVELLTPNTSTMYLMTPVDLSAGPLVFKAPPGLQGAVNNLY
jgi:hypothetical protein